MFRWTFCLVILAGLALSGNAEVKQNFDQEKDWKDAASVYDFKATNIDGKVIPLEEYKGHVLVIVNVASNCSLTDRNYKQLQALYNEFEKNEGLRILAFPSNQFNEQEPGNSKQIKKFVTENYGVTFDMFEKIDVNGDNAHPLWKWLKEQKEGAGTFTNNIKWNFTKFIINKKGQVVKRFGPHEDPDDMKLTLEKYFKEKAE